MIVKVWLIVFMFICAITDIYERKVYTMFCVANGIVIGLIHFFVKDIELSNVMLGVMLGIGFLILSIIYKNAIGTGDGIVLCVIGIALGLVETIEVLIWALIISIVVAITGVCSRKLSMKSTLPFIPFLFLGTIITTAIRGG